MKYLTVSVIVVCLFLSFGTSLLFGQTAVQKAVAQNSIKNLRLRSGKDFQFRVNKGNGTVSFLKAQLTGSLGQNVERSALQVLDAHKDVLGLKVPTEEFVIHNTTQDELGMTHVRLSQHYRGIPVFGSEIVVHFNSEGSARSINGRYFPTTEIEVTPSLSSQQAVEIATAKLSATPILRLPVTTALNIYGKGRELHLVWKVVIPARHPWGNWTYFIDAHSGEVRNFFNDMKTDGPAVSSGPGLDGTIMPVYSYFEDPNYWMIDTSLPMYSGAYERDNTAGAIIGYDAFSIPTDDPGWDIALIRDPNNDNLWDDYPGLRSAVQAQNFFRETLKFFLSEYGRNSWDNQGSSIHFIVHLGEDFNNAFWAGNGVMAFGDGDGLIFSDFTGSLDVIAHEFTHGVTDASARLVYQNQSGALSESISDIFGVLVDDDDWLIGEDIYTPTVPGDAIRSMEDPTLFGDPAHLDDYRFLDPNIDNGGVHTNSGIINKAFYHLATVIGREKAGQIFYRSLTFYMTPLTQFVDARLFCLAAAEDLYGTNSPEYTAVENGFDAVGIFDGLRSLTPVALEFGESVSDVVGLQEYHLYYVDMPENKASLRVATTGTVGNALDLFVSRERMPDPDVGDYVSATFSGFETIEITALSFPPIDSGRYYILVAARDGGSYSITATNTDPQIVYVDQDATGLNDGTSWADADTSIQKGLNDADAEDKWVWVAEGTYLENINMRRGVALFGGFDGTETELNQRDPTTNMTIIDGQNSGHVVNGIDDCRIDGFFIQNGNSFAGGGVYSSFDHNFFITNNVIRNNSASSIGGGIYASGTSSVFSFDQAIIVGNVLHDNSASTNGAGIYFNVTPSIVTMNTVVGNDGDGIFVASTLRRPFVLGNIFWDNTTQVAGSAFVDYSDVQGGYPGLGNIDADPLFVNKSAHDYHLTANSPCIDAGHPLFLDPDSTRQDMGAFYFQQTYTSSEIALRKSKLNFGSVFLGEDAMRVLNIENRGITDLNISSITTANTAYTVSDAAMSIAAGEARNLFVTYTPSTIGSDNDTLRVVSNDVDEGILKVPLNGSGSAVPPEIALFPQALSATVGLNGAATKFVVVENNGVTDLNYQVKVSSASFTSESFGAQDNSFRGRSRMRGNIYHIDVATELSKIEMFMSNSSSTTEIEFVVYQAETLPGPMIRVFNKTISNPGTGQRFYSSGVISVSLQANKYYFIGAAWNNFVTYYLADADPPITTNFGTLEYGSEENLFFPSELIYEPDDFLQHSPYYQRITTGGGGWAAASAATGLIEPDSSASIQIDIDANGLSEGEHHAGITISSNDPHRAQQHIPLHLRVVGDAPSIRHFNFMANTGEFYPIIIDNAVLGMPPEPLEFGDEIGIFTPAGLCVGAAVWTGIESEALGLTAWKDDNQSPEIDGYQDGETMSFRFWDTSANAEYPSKMATYSSGNGTFGFGFLSRISLLEGRVVQTLSTVLSPLWRWISLPVKPDNLDAAALTSSLENLVIMVNCAGDFYVPSPPPFNGIGDIDTHEMYKVYLRGAGTFTITGEDIADNEPIPLTSGWNCVAYFPQREIDVVTALASITENLQIALSDDGGFYVPGLVNTMGNMRTFEGYRLYMANPDTLIYPSSSSALARIAIRTPLVERQTPQFYQPLQRSADYHAVIIDRFSLGSFSLGANDEIGIFTADGLCVGAAKVQLNLPTPVAVWQDDPDKPEHDGYRPGEKLYFRLHRAANNSQHILSSNWSGDLAESPFVQMSLLEQSVPTMYELSGNYPNPFNPETVIRFALPEKTKVKVQIFDMLGRRVQVLLDAEKPGGFHELIWNGRDKTGRQVPSGIYFYKLNAGDFSDIKKMTLIK